MATVLGLDLGTNSLGWALINKNESLIDGGVIIFPRGNNLDPKTGTETSYSQQRTQYRGVRRRIMRRKLRRQRLINLFKEWWDISLSDIFKDSRPEELYRLRAEAADGKQLSISELCRVFLYFAKKRGFKSNRKSQLKDGEDLGEVKRSISEFGNLLKEQNQTLGQYYYELIKDHQLGQRLSERILQRWTGREMYESEFDSIVAEQSKLLPVILADQFQKIRQEIFFQRPLKSAKHLVAKCRFQSEKRVMPRSHPLFQSFRLWQMVHNITWYNKDTGENGQLTYEQKTTIIELYKLNKKPTETQLRKTIGLSTSYKLNDITLKPTSTFIEMELAVGSDAWIQLSENQKMDIYHLMISIQDNKYGDFENALNKKYGLNSDQSVALWNSPLEPDYSSISHKAAKRILPYLMTAFDYAAACVEAGYHHSAKEEFKNLPFIPFLKTNSLRNPVVQKSLNECIKLVNAVIKNYGKPGEVVIELARELKRPKEERKKDRDRMRNTENRREEYAKILSRHYNNAIQPWDSLIKKYELWLELAPADTDLLDFDGFASKIKSSDKQKYDLWLESGRISPYTGQVISLSKLFSAEIEIEHIIPYSRSLDDSTMNKTLCERNFNHEKNKLTPLEFFNRKPENEKLTFIKRIGYIKNKAKRERLLTEALPTDFINSQISDTGYIARKATEIIYQSIEKIRTAKGKQTSELRRLWGVNRLLYEDETRYSEQLVNDIKNRGDHRHHFIDACILACSTISMTQAFAKAEIGTVGRLIGIEIPQPWSSFRHDIREKLRTVLVVHVCRKKLITSSINRINLKDNIQIQRVSSIRGPMHKDTLYGRIQLNNQECFVVRKRVADLKKEQIIGIVDLGIQRFLLSKLEHNSWPDIIKETIFFNEKPLRSVRWNSRLSNLQLIRETTKTYVASEKNYVLAIYQGENGKRDYIPLNFYDAVQLKKSNRQVIPLEYKNKKLLFTLTTLDKILLCEHPDELDFTNFEDIQSRLYHVIKYVDNSIFLGHSIVSKIDANVDKPPIKIKLSTNTLKGIKVKLDLLGKIIWTSHHGKI